MTYIISYDNQCLNTLRCWTIYMDSLSFQWIVIRLFEYIHMFQIEKKEKKVTINLVY